MVRITGGFLRGQRLVVARHPELRPTTERVREAIFSMIQTVLGEARVLDLFAGAGAMGLEAISRGADHAFLVERDPAIAKTILANATRCQVADRVTVLRGSALEPGFWRNLAQRMALPSAPFQTFNIIFLDPPYRQVAAAATALALLDEHGLAADAALAIIEQEAANQVAWPLGWQTIKVRSHGDTGITILRRSRPWPEAGCHQTSASGSPPLAEGCNLFQIPIPEENPL